ncbi:signal peptidase II [Neobacillus ginsengisoli]|uniref:Lipoprotein signal peptidase n=1 Tax=Neobacillus ginsengisoli TaxID=904295 RepID=A0ABT9XUE7_9BACI|nr:signal peptidase II [Neobacillus ginsengisoli]MDQ0198961.1 signal peptidase II [Neobacillus ginsengisoli]
MYYLFIIFVIIIDQLSKYWIRTHLKLESSMEVWKGVLNLTNYENSGAAFSSFQGYGRFFVPIAFLTVIIVLKHRSGIKNKRLIMDLGTGLLIGGAIGNMMDRILYNQVTDFISFHFSNGILNFADYAIQFGIIFLLLDLAINYFLNRKTKDTL